eukprot:3690657-Rhodomonas_salina.1
MSTYHITLPYHPAISLRYFPTPYAIPLLYPLAVSPHPMPYSLTVSPCSILLAYPLTLPQPIPLTTGALYAAILTYAMLLSNFQYWCVRARGMATDLLYAAMRYQTVKTYSGGT